jgi:hypothetical protein
MHTVINDHIEDLNKKLISSFNESNHSLGLAKGKMGFCIYFYITGRLNGNNEYLKIGDKLLDEIYEDYATPKS